MIFTNALVDEIGGTPPGALLGKQLDDYEFIHPDDVEFSTREFSSLEKLGDTATLTPYRLLREGRLGRDGRALPRR